MQIYSSLKNFKR